MPLIATNVGHAEQRPDHLRGSAGFSRCHRGRGDPTAKPLHRCGAIMRAALERRSALATDRAERTAILAADVAASDGDDRRGLCSQDILLWWSLPSSPGQRSTSTLSNGLLVFALATMPS